MQPIRQTEAAECGLACLAMLAHHHGQQVDLASLRRRHPISMKGATLKALIEIGAAMGFGARAIRCEPDELKELKLPAILHWDMNHFVVLSKIRGAFAVILDPALGVRRLRLKEIAHSFTGVALELSPTDGFQRKREKNLLKLSSLVSLRRPVMGALAQAILLSVIIELFVLASPFYMQLVIDEAILKGDADLLTALAIGFGGVTLFQILAGALRSLTLQHVSISLGFDMAAKLFHHLVRLPLDWFHKRQVGDIQSRFQSVQPVQDFIANGAIAALLDGVMSLATLALMALYAPWLAAIVVASVAIYAVTRVASLNLSRKVAGDYLINDAKEQTRFLETLRAAQTLKLAAAEPEREGLQRNAIAATLRSSSRAAHVQIGFQAISQTLTGVTDIVVVFLGAKAILSAEMTVGVLTAFIAYKGQFSGRIVSLVENLIAWRLLDVQMERLADIALTPREAKIDEAGFDSALDGRLEAKRLMFRYAPGEPDILRGADLKIEPGEFVAIAGPSGAGKSTLLKVLVGLYPATYGEIFIDGRPLSSWSPRALRRQIGVVMQDDALLQGSLIENIALFDERPDMVRIEAAARAAAIHDEIMAMPMGYQSLVGDMGSALSGGQKQRVMIARALYRQPKLLIMDEGTSQLDVANEQAINTALRELQVTRLVVAHRPETLRAADRILVLQYGVLTPVQASAPPAQVG